MTTLTEAILSRAQGCLLGQLAGDSLGSLVEFLSPDEIRRRHPDGVRQLATGGTYNTLAGQPTDDSEMALALGRTLDGASGYNVRQVRLAYIDWMNSDPFDIGGTVRAGLSGRPNAASQANGALMRISPLGIFGALRDARMTPEWALQDAAITHPNPICLQASALYAAGIARAIGTGCDGRELYAFILDQARLRRVQPELLEAVEMAESAPPDDFMTQQGWVLIALRNALFQLLYAPTLESGVIDSVRRGGDTDTNGAIAGALLGAVHGLAAVPAQWAEAVLNCRPQAGLENVHQPRPELYWPADALELAERLVRV